MKKLLVTALFALFTVFSFSQEDRTTQYGIRAGINHSNLNFETTPSFNNDSRNGFYFGGFAEFMLSESLHLNTELQFSAEGSKAENFRANYLNFPVQLRFLAGQHFTFGVGPQFGIKTWKDQDNFHTFTFSGVAGIEYRFAEDYFIDLRGVYGFSNMLDDALAPQEAKQILVQLGVGIKI